MSSNPRAKGFAQDLERAWRWREERGVFSELECVRVFHGPGEGSGALRDFAIDRFGAHFWVTSWGNSGDGGAIRAFLEGRGARSAVLISRPARGVPEEPSPLIGRAPEGRFEAGEGTLRFWVQTQGVRHPGLFLDHAPLRAWLLGRARDWRVLNTFAYTGSLSVACGKGGARQVTTLDLSAPSIEWARANWALNALEAGRGEFISGDVFEWLPRLRRSGRQFDCVILDPPSFSRGKKGARFSTTQDLSKLHELAFELLAEGGYAVTSINSAGIPWERFEAEVDKAARAKKLRFQLVSRIEQPETFLTQFPGVASEARYLKGLVLRRI